MVATALQFYAVGLIALTTIEIVARAFYALSDTLTPVLAGGFQILVMWTLSLWLRDVVFSAYGWPPLGALALGFSLSNIVEVMLLLWLVRRKLGGLNGHSLLSGLARMGAASLAMAVAISAVLLLLVSSATWMHAIFGTAVGILAYLLVCWLLRVEELHQFAAMLRRRLPGRK